MHCWDFFCRWPEKLCVVVKQGQTWWKAELVLRTQTVSGKKKKCHSKMILVNKSSRTSPAELDLLTGRMGWCFFTLLMPNRSPTFQNITVEMTAHWTRHRSVFPLVMRPRAFLPCLFSTSQTGPMTAATHKSTRHFHMGEMTPCWTVLCQPLRTLQQCSRFWKCHHIHCVCLLTIRA